LHGTHEAAAQEVFADVQALQLVHGLNLLLTLSSSVVQGLVLLLDEIDLTLDFLLPFVLVLGLSLTVFGLVLANFVQFGFLFYFEDGLLTGLGEKHVQDWLYFAIIVKEIVITDLGDFVDSSLLWDVLWRRWFWQELVSLAFHINLLRNVTVLLRKEKSQVYINAGLWQRSQIVDACVGLLLFEF